MARRSKTVASLLVQNIMRTAESAGMGPAEFTRRTGVHPEELADARERIGRARYERVLDVLYDVDAMRAVAPTPQSLAWVEAGLPLVAAAWLNAPTARAAIDAFVTCRPLLGESDWVTVRERDGAMLIEYVAEGPRHHAAMQAVGNFGMLVNVLRAYDQGPARRFTARLTGAPSRSSRSLAALLGGPVEHGGAGNHLELSTAGLDAPFPHHNPALRRVVERKLAEDLAELAREASLALGVERALRRALAGRSALPGHQLLAQVCAELRFTRWTLRRRLAAEGLTFKQLHARVRLQEARRLLEQSSLSLAEVGDHLGFTTQSSFTRFFRQGAGITPQRYREAVDGDG